jgi:FKBP-type peptidyl-prolyl cis-trans isomerase SlyD
MPLTFDVTVREVRQATPDEISHGHAHGPGGHHHH